MKLSSFSFFLIVALFAVSCSSSKEYHIKILATNDIHGAFFDSTYVSRETNSSSLSKVFTIVKRERRSVGKNSFILLDGGDVLQGDNSCYYYNFIDSTSTKHLVSRIFDFMKYDVWVIGNHDIETGHPVYDKIAKEVDADFLGANVIDVATGKPYFKPYTILEKGGLRVAIIGMTNANIKQWLSEELWKGLTFEELYPLADSLVQRVRREENPDLVVLACHAGIHLDSEYNLENPTRFLAHKIKGVDIVFGAHDHVTNNYKVFNGEDSVLVIEGGSRAKKVALVDVIVRKESGEVVSKEIKGEIIDASYEKPDLFYVTKFEKDYKTVKGFSSQKIGTLTDSIQMSEALGGMSSYMNLIHLVQLEATGSDISFSAPLNLKNVIRSGDITFDDLFLIYQYENYLYKIRMTGEEIKKYLEYSYYTWTENKAPAFNFDSAGGLIYTVDSEMPKGKKVNIISMADGTPFLLNKDYSVAMTSYRASGAGSLLGEAGISSAEMSDRIITMYPEVRELIHQYVLEKGVINPTHLENNPKLGNWKFIQ